MPQATKTCRSSIISQKLSQRQKKKHTTATAAASVCKQLVEQTERRVINPIFSSGIYVRVIFSFSSRQFFSLLLLYRHIPSWLASLVDGHGLDFFFGDGWTHHVRYNYCMYNNDDFGG